MSVGSSDETTRLMGISWVSGAFKNFVDIRGYLTLRADTSVDTILYGGYFGKTNSSMRLKLFNSQHQEVDSSHYKTAEDLFRNKITLFVPRSALTIYNGSWSTFVRISWFLEPTKNRPSISGTLIVDENMFAADIKATMNAFFGEDLHMMEVLREDIDETDAHHKYRPFFTCLPAFALEKLGPLLFESREQFRRSSTPAPSSNGSSPLPRKRISQSHSQSTKKPTVGSRSRS